MTRLEKNSNTIKLSSIQQTGLFKNHIASIKVKHMKEPAFKILEPDELLVVDWRLETY